MASLTVRDIPNDLYERFKQLAKKEHRSLNSEVIAVLDRAVNEAEIVQERREAWESITRRLAEKAPLGGDSVAMLREDRER